VSARPARAIRFAAAALAAIVMACGGAPGQAPAAGQAAAKGSTQAAQARTAPAPTFDGARAWTDLERQVAIGPRPSGSDAIAETRAYIRAQLAEAGVETREQAFTAMTPLGPVPMANVIGTIPGARPERIALASHYDTKLFEGVRFVGANDGGSSTAVLIELGRALAGRDNAFTIELLFFDGEEARRLEWRDPDNTYGSRHYVAAAQKDGSLKGLEALVLLDMVGDRELRLRKELASTPWLVDLIWAAAGRLGHRATFSNEYAEISDDHVPFLRAGVPAADLIDLETPSRRNSWHTEADNLENVRQQSLQIVGDVVLAALPDLEAHLLSTR
jgi:Zn-dependent M28 family amino/carboxypeptidase